MDRTTKIVLLLAFAAVFIAIGAILLRSAKETSLGRTDTALIKTTSSSPSTVATSTFPLEHSYIEITDSCGPYYGGSCVNARSGPGTGFPSVAKLRTGMVLEVNERVTLADGTAWYKIAFSEWLRYPERITHEWYVAANVATLFNDSGEQKMRSSSMVSDTGKLIIIDKAAEFLTAYEGDQIFMEAKISIGLDGTPTPLGTFNIYKKTPSRYMQGPIPGVSEQEYDLPGVPWTMYFSEDGAAIHGAYWHDHFGQPWSHGCVNLSPADAKKLYEWADIGTPVVVGQ